MTPLMGTRRKMWLARGLRSAVMSVRRLFGRSTRCPLNRRGLRWALDLNEGIDLAIYLLGVFEPATVRAYLTRLRPGQVAIDVGANLGAHTLPMARAVAPYGRVIAVEPTDYAFGKLQTNLSLNPRFASRVTPVQAFLSDRDAVDQPPDAVYSSWPLTASDEAAHPLHRGQLKACRGARRVTLDHLVQALGLDEVALIKIDIDGYECEMLRGAAGTLRRFRPLLILELAPYVLEEHGDSAGEFLGLLRSAGYCLRDLASGTDLPLDPGTWERMLPRGSSRNVLAYWRPPVSRGGVGA